MFLFGVEFAVYPLESARARLGLVIDATRTMNRASRAEWLMGLNKGGIQKVRCIQKASFDLWCSDRWAFLYFSSPTMRSLSSFAASKHPFLGLFNILFLSSFSLSIKGISRRGFVATASAFSQQNHHKKLAFSPRTFSSKSKLFSAKDTAAMVESPPIARREEDRGTLVTTYLLNYVE